MSVKKLQLLYAACFSNLHDAAFTRLNLNYVQTCIFVYKSYKKFGLMLTKRAKAYTAVKRQTAVTAKMKTLGI